MHDEPYISVFLDFVYVTGAQTLRTNFPSITVLSMTPVLSIYMCMLHSQMCMQQSGAYIWIVLQVWSIDSLGSSTDGAVKAIEKATVYV